MKLSSDHWAARPVIFAGVFLAIFFVSATLLYVIDFVPEAPQAHQSDESDTLSAPAVALPEDPLRVRIAAIGVDTPVSSPATTSVAVLEESLLAGAVRYPLSARLNENGTVYLFGHQSYLPVVHNQAFKAFNNLQKLKEGDEIEVSSAEARYVYRVSSVRLTTAADGVVQLGTEGKTLILSTCNSLSSDHEERYVVEAVLVSRTAGS